MLGVPNAPVWPKEGGVGCFLRKLPPMLLMGLMLRVVTWGVLRAFATLLRRFGEGPKAKTRTGLAFVVSHPCLKNRGTAMAFGGLDDFSDIFLHGVCPPED